VKDFNNVPFLSLNTTINIKEVIKMTRRGIVVGLFISYVAVLAGCGAAQHAASTQEGLQGNRLTVGTVQKEIRKGMSGAEVAEALGSPNIVSTDEQGREVWIYDKISTDKVQSESSGYGTLILFGYRGSAGSSSTSQQTITIIIKFDSDKKVRDFAYHASRF
jgi:outer membrane protein assembly factor BamE (lipoprotein component of BamABCDE complex)